MLRVHDTKTPQSVLRPMAGRRACVARLVTLGAARAVPAMLFGSGLPLQAWATGLVVLTVSGRLRVGSSVHFDMNALAAMPQKDIVSATPWYSRARGFTGPLLREVLATAGAHEQATRLRLTALNDYRVEIPMDDVRRYDVILARLRDGEPMAVRDKGPLFVMYPFDGHPELQGAVHYSRAIWQLRHLEVL